MIDQWTMKHWSFYDPATGIFATRKFGGLAQHVAANTPSGLVAIEGDYDHATQRVDVATGAVVAYVSPEAQRDRRAEFARARIAKLERSQLRPIREIAVDPNNAEAKRRLAEIEGEIAELRLSLRM